MRKTLLLGALFASTAFATAAQAAPCDIELQVSHGNNYTIGAAIWPAANRNYDGILGLWAYDGRKVEYDPSLILDDPEYRSQIRRQVIELVQQQCTAHRNWHPWYEQGTGCGRGKIIAQPPHYTFGLFPTNVTVNCGGLTAIPATPRPLP